MEGYVRTLYVPTFVGKHGDAFRRSSSCDLPPHEPATTRPHRGRIWKIPPCRDHKRLRSSVPRHLVGLADFHQDFPQKLLRTLSYCSIRFIAQTPGGDPVDCPRPRRHCFGVESAGTGAPPTHKNLPSVETCKTIPCCNLWRLAPPAPSPSPERKPALPNDAMVGAIVIQNRFHRLGRIISRIQDPRGRSPQVVALLSADYTQ